MGSVEGFEQRRVDLHRGFHIHRKCRRKSHVNSQFRFTSFEEENRFLVGGFICMILRAYGEIGCVVHDNGTYEIRFVAFDRRAVFRGEFDSQRIRQRIGLALVKGTFERCDLIACQVHVNGFSLFARGEGDRFGQGEVFGRQRRVIGGVFGNLLCGHGCQRHHGRQRRIAAATADVKTHIGVNAEVVERLHVIGLKNVFGNADHLMEFGVELILQVEIRAGGRQHREHRQAELFDMSFHDIILCLSVNIPEPVPFVDWNKPRPPRAEANTYGQTIGSCRQPLPGY